MVEELAENRSMQVEEQCTGEARQVQLQYSSKVPFIKVRAPRHSPPLCCSGLPVLSDIVLPLSASGCRLLTALPIRKLPSHAFTNHAFVILSQHLHTHLFMHAAPHHDFVSSCALSQLMNPVLLRHPPLPFSPEMTETCREKRSTYLC